MLLIYFCTEDIASHADVVLRGSSRVPVPLAEHLRRRLRKTGRHFDLEKPIKGLLQRVREGCSLRKQMAIRNVTTTQKFHTDDDVSLT